MHLRILMAGVHVAAVLALAALPAKAQTPGKDSIVIAGGIDIVGLNGLDVVTIVPDRMLMNHISDTLLQWSSEGELKPRLAIEWKTLSPLVWELKLRQGVKFQNGEPFNAAAVKFFYDTMGDPSFKSPAKSNHVWVAKTEIIDEFTVRFTTKEPFPTAPNQWTIAHMVPPKYVSEVGIDGYRKKPVGTGPYKLVEFVRDTRAVFEAFDGWWGGPQDIKRITYRPIKEDAARVSALLAGEIDLAFDVPPELIPVVERARNAMIKREFSVRSYMLWFNNRSPSSPTAHPKVREAINYAVDRISLNKHVLGGTGTPTAWLNPKSFGVNPALAPIPYDPERAKKLLAEAGYPNGFDLVLDSPQGRYIKDKEMAEAIAGQLAKVGIRTTAKVYEWGVFTKRMWSHQSSPVTLMAWVDTGGDTDTQNNRVLKTNGAWSQYTDPKLDSLMESIRTEMDVEKRKKLIYEQQDYMRQTFPVAYLIQMGIVIGVSPKLKNWQPQPDEKHAFYSLKVAN